MALLTVNGSGVIRGVISLPRSGAWHADLDVDVAEVVTGPAELKVAESLVLKATVSAGYTFEGIASLRLVGGNDGMRKRARAQHYVRPSVRTVLGDLLRAAGETLSPTVSSTVLGRSLGAWTVLANPIGEQLGALVQRATPEGTVWRILPDGSVWLGSETWPASPIKEWRELDRDPENRRLVLGLDAPTLLPGTTLGEDRVDYVEHVIDDAPARIRSHVWMAAP